RSTTAFVSATGSSFQREGRDALGYDRTSSRRPSAAGVSPSCGEEGMASITSEVIAAVLGVGQNEAYERCAGTHRNDVAGLADTPPVEPARSGAGGGCVHASSKFHRNRTGAPEPGDDCEAGGTDGNSPA